MRRREFITLLGGAVASPPALRAQDRVRRLGVLLPFDDTHPIGKQRLAAMIDGLRKLGWIDGQNIRIDVRATAGNAAEIRKLAAELVALGPDVIFASGSSTTGPLLQVTRTAPIVFAYVIDPVGGGLVDSLARPGGNATGFIQFEYSISGKWLELLKELAPGVKRVAVIRDAATSGPRSVRSHPVCGVCDAS